MDDLTKIALELVKAQAAVRVMTDEEIISMTRSLVAGLSRVSVGGESEVEVAAPSVTPEEAKNSIKENSVTCLECGKVFKFMTSKHLASHGLDKASYCEKYGLKKDTALVAKRLQRERRKKMADMKLWEKHALSVQNKKKALAEASK